MSGKDLLGTRRLLKSRKPKFKRQNQGLKSKLTNNSGWRKPKGYHSKLRLRRKSRGAFVSPGYKSPVAVRGLSREGLVPVNVSNPEQLNGLQKGVHGVMVNSAIGMRKRLAVIELAIKAGLKVLNFKDAAGYLNDQKAEFDKRTKEKKEKKKPKKAQSIEEKISKPEEKKAPEEEKTEEEKKKEEKQEQDKVLTKRQ